MTSKATDQAGVSESWRKEIKRRRKDFHEGKANPVSAKEALRQARAAIRKAPKYISVQEAEYVSGHKLRLLFNDMTERVMDFGSFLKQARNPMITKYRRLKEFKAFTLKDGDVMWGDFEMIFPVWDLYRGEI